MWRPEIKVVFVRLWRGEVSMSLLYLCVQFLCRILFGHPVWLAGHLVLYAPVSSLWEHPSPMVLMFITLVLCFLCAIEDRMEG